MTAPYLLHWAVLNISYTITDTGVKIVTTTNHPCHLTMRWTTMPPQKHIDIVIERGAPIDKIPRLCFVVFKDNEQEEAGDTYTHTFIKEPWASCETRWFYFWGTVNGEDTLSESPIFEYHRVAGPQTVTFYPDPDPGVTSCDGQVGQNGQPSPYAWNTLRNAAGSHSSTSGATLGIFFQCTGATNGWWVMYRSILTFDTSIIPATATILEAKLRAYGEGKGGELSAPLFSLCVVSSSPASNNVLVPADFTKLSTTLLSDTKILFADLVVDDWNEFPFNSAGLLAIAKAGITKLGIREGGYDLPDSAPTWEYRKWKNMYFASAESVPLRPPELIVTYQP